MNVLTVGHGPLPTANISLYFDCEPSSTCEHQNIMEHIQTGSQRLRVAKQPCKEQHHARCQRGSDQSLEPDRKQGGSQLQLQAWPPTTWGRVILLCPVFARSFFKPAVLRKQGRMNQDTIFSQTPHTRLIRGDAELRKVT